MAQSVKELALGSCPAAARHTPGSTRKFLSVPCTVSVRSSILSVSSFSTNINGDGWKLKKWLATLENFTANLILDVKNRN